MIALALFMTVFIMQPVWSKVNTEALQPYSAGTISQTEAMDRAMTPIRQFMAAHTPERSGFVYHRVRRRKATNALRSVQLAVDSGVCSKRVEDGVSDGLYALRSISCSRHGGRFNINGDGYDDVAACAHLIAL